MLSMTELAVTTAEALDYTSRGGLAVELQETDLMRGQRYVAVRFNPRWLGEWENDEAPEPVKHAVIEAALVEQRTPGSLSAVSTPGTDKVLVAAGKLQWERVKGPAGADGYIPRVSAVEGLLAGLVRTGSGGVSLLMRA
ncbi:MAG: hypothetical protein Q4615_14215 [Paracoccus aminovorans]|nr:hypothetical protein [Paracoccus aminovorans]